MQVNDQNICDVMQYHQQPEIKYIFHDLQDDTFHKWSVGEGAAQLKTFATNLEIVGGKISTTSTTHYRDYSLQHTLIANLDPERSFLGNFIAILSYVTSGQRVNPNKSFPSPAPPRRSSSSRDSPLQGGWGPGHLIPIRSKVKELD
jgi:hypothetical protein